MKYWFIVLSIVVSACTQPTVVNTWEYKVEPICRKMDIKEFLPLQSMPKDEIVNYPNTCIAPEKVEALLNKLGAEGWELVAIQTPLSGYGAGFPFTENGLGIPIGMDRLIMKRYTPPE